jgi:hypothetical protein
MVIRFLGGLRQAVGEGHRLTEVVEPIAALERAANLVPAFWIGIGHAPEYPRKTEDGGSS